MDYQVKIRAKNQTWYNNAAEYPSLKDWELWDDGKTAKFIDAITFKFVEPVTSIEIFEKSESSIIIVNAEHSRKSITLQNVTRIEFKGATTKEVIISDSILEQSFIDRRNRGRTYVYCYIKGDAEYNIIADNIWLSDEHVNLLKEKLGEKATLLLPVTEVLNFSLLR